MYGSQERDAVKAVVQPAERETAGARVLLGKREKEVMAGEIGQQPQILVTWDEVADKPSRDRTRNLGPGSSREQLWLWWWWWWWGGHTTPRKGTPSWHLHNQHKQGRIPRRLIIFYFQVTPQQAASACTNGSKVLLLPVIVSRLRRVIETAVI